MKGRQLSPRPQDIDEKHRALGRGLRLLRHRSDLAVRHDRDDVASLPDVDLVQSDDLLAMGAPSHGHHHGNHQKRHPHGHHSMPHNTRFLSDSCQLNYYLKTNAVVKRLGEQ